MEKYLLIFFATEKIIALNCWALISQKMANSEDITGGAQSENARMAPRNP